MALKSQVETTYILAICSFRLYEMTRPRKLPVIIAQTKLRNPLQKTSQGMETRIKDVKNTSATYEVSSVVTYSH